MESIPYNIINLKETNYPNNLNFIGNNISLKNFKENSKALDSVINNLIEHLENIIFDLEKQQEPTLNLLKEQLEVELRQSKKLFEKLKTFES